MDHVGRTANRAGRGRAGTPVATDGSHGSSGSVSSVSVSESERFFFPEGEASVPGESGLLRFDILLYSSQFIGSG